MASARKKASARRNRKPVSRADFAAQAKAAGVRGRKPKGGRGKNRSSGSTDSR